jgi:HAD superfamily hydrolase (TIGR01549 family)
MPGRFKAILFDLGNTLLFFNGDWTQIFAKSDQALLTQLLSTGIDLNEDIFLREFRARMDTYYDQREADFLELTTGYILRNVLARMGHPQVDDEIICTALRKMYAVSQKYWLPAEDTISTLQMLQEQVYRMGIISNASDDADVQTLVDNTKMRSYFDFILSSAAIGIRKPNSTIFEIALSNWPFTPQQIAMVGDTLDADILGANNMGIFSVWITRQADSSSNQKNAAKIIPNAIIESLSELPDLLMRAA